MKPDILRLKKINKTVIIVIVLAIILNFYFVNAYLQALEGVFARKAEKVLENTLKLQEKVWNEVVNEHPELICVNNSGPEKYIFITKYRTDVTDDKKFVILQNQVWHNFFEDCFEVQKCMNRPAKALFKNKHVKTYDTICKTKYFPQLEHYRKTAEIVLGKRKATYTTEKDTKEELRRIPNELHEIEATITPKELTFFCQKEAKGTVLCISGNQNNVAGILQ